MQFEEYEIVSITSELTDVFIIRLKPKNKKNISAFRPGQFYHLKNPTYDKPSETRQFSVITTPKTKNYLEFCIKIYGSWTKALLEKKSGESIWLFGPMGVFTLEQKAAQKIFIAGGVGITPILSMMQSLHEKKTTLPITLIYANKSPEHMVRKKQIESLFQKKALWKFISLVSQTDGYITGELLKQEIGGESNPLFYVSGSQRFTKNIITLLEDLGIPETHMKQEIFLPPYPQKKR
jgi:ferredoxin-NADP reductase